MISQVINKIINNDIGYSFVKSKIAVISTIVFLTILICSTFAELVAPYNPFDPVNVSLLDAFTPPVWADGGSTNFVLGTDQQGRDMLSTMIYGSRISLIVGFASILFAMLLGTFLGVTSGFFGGRYEIIVMRFTDVQLTIPSILMALLVDGIARGFISKSLHNDMENKEYILASRIIGLSNFLIMFKHILPNILRPILVIFTIGLALAIITESTLSFLGVGVPPTTPSLGTLIRFGNDFLFSGEWWITFFPAIFLVVLALSINLLGDWMRDTLNPKLKTR